MQKKSNKAGVVLALMPLIPIMFSAAAVLFGVYFEPDTIRVLWIVLAGVSTAAGLAMLVGVQLMARAIKRGQELKCPMIELMQGAEQQVAE